MSTTTTDPGSKPADQIEHEVEQTRARVSGTLDALRDKLEPSQIVDEVVDRISLYAKSSGGAEFARNLGASVRDNPLPVLLIGAGIGWLLLAKTNSPPAYSRYDADYSNGTGSRASPSMKRVGDRISGVKDRVDAGVEQVTETLGDAASRAAGYVKEAASRTVSAASRATATLSDAADTTYETAVSIGTQAGNAAGAVRDHVDEVRDRAVSLAQETRGRWDQLSNDQPLLIGVLGVAVGAALGAALPRSQAEDRLMGGARDAVVDRVTDVASESYEEVRAAIGDEVEHAKHLLTDTYARTKDRLNTDGLGSSGNVLSEAVGDIAETLGTVASEVAARVKPVIAEPGAGKERSSNDDGARTNR